MSPQKDTPSSPLRQFSLAELLAQYGNPDALRGMLDRFSPEDRQALLRGVDPSALQSERGDDAP